MEIQPHFVVDPDVLTVIPTLVIRRGDCGDPTCSARHAQIAICFLWLESGFVITY